MPTLLFTGKGGVGKTTLAAATAVGLAKQGKKTLVLSTDPAHSLADALETPLGSEPSEVDSCLSAAQIDSRGLVDNVWKDLRAQLADVLSGSGLDSLDAAELTVLPGIDELLALTEVRRLVEESPSQHVVVDCGPTAETLRLLALPEAVSGYLGRAFVEKPPQRWTIRRRSDFRHSIERLRGHLDSLRDLLTDQDRTRVRLVVTPERLVVAESRRTLSSLALRGIRVDGVIVNRLVPAPGWWRGTAASWLRARRKQQDEVLGELTESLGGVRIRSVEHRAVEPIGQGALDKIATELYASSDPVSDEGQEPIPLLRMSESDGGYRLRVALPLERGSEVGLARVDDDLAITIDGFRRLIALPELLRGYEITDAESDADGLVVVLAAAGETDD